MISKLDKNAKRKGTVLTVPAGISSAHPQGPA